MNVMRQHAYTTCGSTRVFDEKTQAQITKTHLRLDAGRSDRPWLNRSFNENPQAKIEIDPPSPVRQLYYYKGSKSIESIRTRANNVVPGPRRQTGASTCRFEV